LVHMVSPSAGASWSMGIACVEARGGGGRLAQERQSCISTGRSAASSMRRRLDASELVTAGLPTSRRRTRAHSVAPRLSCSTDVAGDADLVPFPRWVRGRMLSSRGHGGKKRMIRSSRLSCVPRRRDLRGQAFRHGTARQ
jgi:hypothetical protein